MPRRVAADVETRAGRVRFDAVGEGPPLVLLSTAAHNRRDWDPVRDILAKQFRTIAFDWPGHGESPPPKPGWPPSAPGFADVVEDVVEALDLEPTVFMGNSIGGFASARLALRQPDAVRALVLIDSGGFLKRTPAVRAATALLGCEGFLRRIYPLFVRAYLLARNEYDRGIVTRNVRSMSGPPLSTVVAALWRSFSTPEHDLRDQVRNLSVPTLVVWGRYDLLIPVRNGRWLAEATGGDLAVLDTGHVPFSSRPDEFLAVVRPFLERVRTSYLGGGAVDGQPRGALPTLALPRSTTCRPVRTRGARMCPRHTGHSAPPWRRPRF
jgi:pimeloyl-ACP methyl ester carboxylesterase